MPISCRRASVNPILKPSMVKASRDDYEVVGVFNPAAIRRNDETLLLLRVAEAPRGIAEGEVAAPIYDASKRDLVVKRFRKDAPNVDWKSDTRVIKAEGEVFLTSISHLRLARSRDGIAFTVDDKPLIQAESAIESFGIEDGRITYVDNKYYINFTAVSPHGIATGLAETIDFVTARRHGIIFPPANRDVTIFPEKIGGKFMALHRPMPTDIGTPEIWIASSPDMLPWGEHRFGAGARKGRWDDLKIGGGAVPFRVQWRGHHGFLAIYHGVTASPLTYSLGAILLDAADPSKILARSPTPVLRPEAPYECKGFFGNVVFTCGLVVQGDVASVYYGAADGVTAVADITVSSILDDLEAVA
ncbi:MAG: glycoside hydrolase family 130 protein [Polyangiales bacterium]